MNQYLQHMRQRISRHDVWWWLLSATSAGLLYDALKSSIVASGFERFLPDLVFLVKPIMVVLGLATGGIVLTLSWRTIKTWHRKTRRDRERAAMTWIEFLSEFQQGIRSETRRIYDTVETRAKREQVMLAIDNLDLYGLLHPDLVERAKSPDDSIVMDQLAVARVHLENRGMTAARKKVKNFPVTPPKTIDQQNDDFLDLLSKND